jgi:myo-inositol-1-phosphate synthase
MLDKVVIVNLASPHKNIKHESWFENSNEFFKKIETNDEAITSGMLYCLAAINEGCPFVDFTPSATLIPKAIIEEAERQKVPIAGRDGSTGQTLMKSVLATMFNQRNLRVNGWFSTNILGNLDGYVLSDNNYNKEKILDKTEVLDKILGYHPEHLVEIKYFKTKGDSKESWDYIDFEGWLGETMQLKINWVGKDSLLAAPLVLDLVRLIAYAKSCGHYGMQKQLSLFFKHPLQTEERSFTNLYHDFINFYKKI